MAGSIGLTAGGVVIVARLAVAVMCVATDGTFSRHLSPGVPALAMPTLPFVGGAPAARFLLNGTHAFRAAHLARIAGTTAGALALVVYVVVSSGGVAEARW